MSLGVKDEVGDQIIRCVAELGRARAIDVAKRLFDDGLKPVLCFGAVGTKMMEMERRGMLAFVDGRYEMVKGE